MVPQAEIDALLAWIREPDHAEEFSLADAVDWINRRPISTVMKLAGQTPPAPLEPVHDGLTICNICGDTGEVPIPGTWLRGAPVTTICVCRARKMGPATPCDPSDESLRRGDA